MLSMTKIQRNPGDRNGRLTLVEEVQRDKNDPIKSRRRWRLFRFKCDCGKEVVAHWKPKSCGCLQTEAAAHWGRARRKQSGESNFGRIYIRYVNNATASDREFRLTRDEFKALTQADCFYCAAKPAMVENHITRFGAYTYNSVDRVDSQKGYTTDNTVPACKMCQIAKHNYGAQEFYDWVKRLHANLSSKNLL